MGRRACSMAQLLLVGFLAVTAAVTAAEPSIRGAKASPGSRFISYDDVLAEKASQAAAAASEQVQQQADSAAATPVPDSGKPAPKQEQQQKPVVNKPASDLLSGLVGNKPTAAAGQQLAAAEAPKLAEERQPAAAPSEPAAEEQKQQQQQQPAVQQHSAQDKPAADVQQPSVQNKPAADVKQPSAQDKPAADVDKSASQTPPTALPTPADQPKPDASEKPAAAEAPQTQQPAAQPKPDASEKPAATEAPQTQQPAAQKPEGQEGRPVQQQKPELPLAAEVPAKQVIPECTTGACCQNGRFKPKTEQCRAAKHPCDEPEFCTGTSATCPEDDSKNKPDGTTCAWLPASNPTVGRFMADASKLQRSAVSLQAAMALMPTVASTQAYGSSSDAGLQQCTGKCYQGLCSVDFDILHCCVAKQHYLQKRREEAHHHHGRDYPEPDYPEIYNRQHDKTRDEYFYGPDFEAYTDAAARHPESRKSHRHGPEVPVKATTSRTRLVVDDPYAADYVAQDIQQYQELYEELHDAEEQISQVLRRKYQDLDSLERDEQDAPDRGYVRHEDGGAPYTPEHVGEDSPHSYGKEGEEGAPYAPWWEEEHPADGYRAYCWQ